jgi:excisionase family DNA binding protein
MPTQPPNSKNIAAAPSISVPPSWNESIAASATTSWEDTIPAAQQGKAKSGPQGQLLLVGEVATVLRCTDATVCKYLRDGVMTGHRIGGKWRVFEADLDAFLFKTMTDSPCSTPGAAGAPTLLAPISAIGPKGTPAKSPYFLDPTQV